MKECSNGLVFVEALDTSFECDNIDFLALIPNNELRVFRQNFTDRIFEQSDIWGWVSPTSGKEYTLSCGSNAVWFIDGTEIENVKKVGYIESRREESFFCDVKVLQNTAYIAYNGFNPSVNGGIQVFDLLRLDEISTEDNILEPDFVYEDVGTVSNLAINTENAALYAIGATSDICEGSLHVLDLSNRLLPSFLNCGIPDISLNDVFCVRYKGPDESFQGVDICFGLSNFNILIFDVSDSSNIIQVGVVNVPSAISLQHGTLSVNHDYFLSSDTGDEQRGTVSKSTTYIIDVTNLRNPELIQNFQYDDLTVDGNIFFWGVNIQNGYTGSASSNNGPNVNYAYAANFASGLRILNTKGLTDRPPRLQEVGYFDTTTATDNSIIGTWSSFMFPSGKIALSDMTQGIFFLSFSAAFVDPPDPIPTQKPTKFPVATPPFPDITESPTIEVVESGVGGLPGGFAVLYIFIFVLTILLILFNINIFNRNRSKSQSSATNPDENLGYSRMSNRRDEPVQAQVGSQVSQRNPMFDEGEYFQ